MQEMMHGEQRLLGKRKGEEYVSTFSGDDLEPGESVSDWAAVWAKDYRDLRAENE